MIGAHVGNWEIGAPFFDEYGKKINIVMFDAEHERIKEILEKNASTRDYKIIPVNEDNLTHVFRITEALERKEYVCFQGDRYLNKEKLLSSPFMGKEAEFPMGPFLLASKMRVPVVFYFAMREAKKNYRFHFFIAEAVVHTKEKRVEQALLEQYTQTLEKIIRQYPEQWFNYYPFWA
ncbi:lysophospholipid acyltransferase family protein, partial [Phocaeicola dorei]